MVGTPVVFVAWWALRGDLVTSWILGRVGWPEWLDLEEGHAPTTSRG